MGRLVSGQHDIFASAIAKPKFGNRAAFGLERDQAYWCDCCEVFRQPMCGIDWPKVERWWFQQQLKAAVLCPKYLEGEPQQGPMIS
jgi:hypothetical protein